MVVVLFCFAVFLNIGDAYKSSGFPPSNTGSSFSHSQSSSSVSHSSSSSYSSASSVSSVDCHEDKCGQNSTYKQCPDPCPPTCGNPKGVPNCYKKCEPYGCECNPGYVSSENGKCILWDDCPDYLRCNGDRNAVFKDCPEPCPASCEFPGSTPCTKNCTKNGCECKPGFYLNNERKCVNLQDCPGAKKCSINESFVFCNVNCPTNRCPVDDSRGIIACSPPYPCGSGCSCKAGYLRFPKGDGRCILSQDCPAINCTRPNEVYCPKPPPCLFEECTDIGQPNHCDRTYPNKPQCVCKPGYYRNQLDICVCEDQCEKPQSCGLNEIAVDCKTECPPQSCDISYTDYFCFEMPCVPGCDCLPNYLRNATGCCIPNNECPPPPTQPQCGVNEELSECKIKCPPQNCTSLYAKFKCPENITCESGCNCIKNYLRDANGKCIPSSQCSSHCDIPPKCRPTCSNPEPNCPEHSYNDRLENQDGCACKPGHILSNPDGVCIKIEECPDEGCNGDPNSIVTACPWPCPSTCDTPEAGAFGHTCDSVGCQCKPGFILLDDTGKCFLPEACPCGNPCGPNGTFSDCAYRCSNQYCPEDDTLFEVACRPGRPCPSGCLCNPYYLKKSYEDETCVLASDCPPVTCTRPREVWDPCASECLRERCDGSDSYEGCVPDPKNCQPQCVCCEGFLRDSSGICIPKNECPRKCEVPQECRPTCAVPNPPNCSYIQPAETNVDECNCQAGDVLSGRGGKCIKIEDCPTNQTCNSDPNARIKLCPPPCPSTCEAPNAFPCKRMCDPIGCECKPGYMRSENGNCILPDQCKGGNPCGPNATFNDCPLDCSTNYCPTDDSRAVVVCERSSSEPCFSGCSCRLNYRRLSRENPICVLSTDCPPVNCTRDNEKWNSCPSPCRSERCEAVDDTSTVCNTLVFNGDPKCECQKSYFRNDKDVCVSSDECRRLNLRKKTQSQGNNK